MNRKRPVDDVDDTTKTNEPIKQQRLGAFFDVKEWKPTSFVGRSKPITDRGSTFIAFTTTVTCERDARHFQRYIRALRTPGQHPNAADHEMLAWRTVQLRIGKDGTGGTDDFTVSVGGDDDGEKNGSRTIRQALEQEAAMDCACVVSRYYGGQLLGPARFNHITDVATEAIRRWADDTQVKELVQELKELDQQILVFSPNEASVINAKYDNLDKIKAARLVKARQLRLEVLQKQIIDDAQK